MTSDDKPKHDGVLLLASGLLVGTLIGACVCYCYIDQAKSATPQTIVVAAPAQTADATATMTNAPTYQPPLAQTVSSFSPAEPVTSAITVSSSGSGGQYTSINPVYAGSPSWTVGRNGLMQNPSVDPPSSHGRAYNANGYY